MSTHPIVPWLLAWVIISGVVFLQAPPARASTPIGGAWLPEIVTSAGVASGGSFLGMGTPDITLASNVTLLAAWVTYETTQVQTPYVNWSLGPQAFTCSNGDPTMQSTDAGGTVKAMQLRFCYLNAPTLGTGKVWYNLSHLATGCTICGNGIVVTAFARTDPTSPLGLPASENDGGHRAKTQFLNVSLASGTAVLSYDVLSCDGWSGDCKPAAATGTYSHQLIGWNPGPWYGNGNAPAYAESIASFYTTATSQARMTTNAVGASPVWVAGRVTVYGAEIISSSPWTNPQANVSSPGFYDWLPPFVFLMGLSFMVIVTITIGIEAFSRKR